MSLPVQPAMDPLSAVASVAGLVGLAAQIAASIKQHDFWSSVADTPVSLRWLLADVQLVHDLVHSIEASFARSAIPQGSTDPLQQLLERCFADLASLEGLVKTVLPVPGDSCRKATWKSIKATLKKDKFKSYREHLVSAKITLLLAQGYVNQQHIDSRFDALETRIASLSLANSTAALEERIAIEAQKITASILESCSTISLVGAMAPSIQATVSSAIETAMRSHLPQQPSSSRDTEITRAGNTRKSHRLTSIKHYNTPFKRFEVRTIHNGRDVVGSEWDPHDLSASSPKPPETEIFFLPRRWMSSTARRLSIQWEPSSHWGFSGFRVKYHPVVPTSSPILRACQDGDVALARCLPRCSPHQMLSVNTGCPCLL
ncbi:hypothetical protein B0T26DRAFT_517551 [Lasiosphaeria miniovina]|uniref:Fungal N-terminal domain-containing protein n=1 Tax=Lasiosphaeria miniovina TaxID=1954250 RepID=A0AA39ZUN4_9PEZI|nr:uncharacterized protein B0T26DRAFT_517551 [Lasiosphaeria miniovina]KAK0703902.1 hypothetical protein B0T26DRAFT_517551 [Lasiosphaeria miniovina]